MPQRSGQQARTIRRKSADRGSTAVKGNDAGSWCCKKRKKPRSLERVWFVGDSPLLGGQLVTASYGKKSAAFALRFDLPWFLGSTT